MYVQGFLCDLGLKAFTYYHIHDTTKFLLYLTIPFLFIKTISVSQNIKCLLYSTHEKSSQSSLQVNIKLKDR